MCNNKRTNDVGVTEYFDGEYWMHENSVCQHCINDQTGHYRFAEPRNSFGCYAGRYCDECWKHSGFRDATDPDAVFDPMDAGESLEPDYDYVR